MGETAGGPVEHEVVEVESGRLSSLHQTGEHRVRGQKRTGENVVDALKQIIATKFHTQATTFVTSTDV